MKKVKSHSLFISFCLVAAVFMLMLSFLAMPASTTFAESAANFAYSENLTVSVRNHQGIVDNGTAGTVSLVNGSTTTADYASRTLNWADVRNFSLSFNTNSLPEADSYTYSYTVTWAPQTISNGQVSFNTEYASTKTIKSASNVSKENIVSSLNFFIDDNRMAGDNNITASDIFEDNYNVKFGGWGTYLFSFECGGISSSAVYELKPTDISTLETPKLTVTEKGMSNTGSGSAYIISVDESYKYVNRELIKWSVSGKDRDGKEYVLAPADKEISGNQDKATLEPNDAIIRTGLSFTFDPKIEGTWAVRCDILDAPNGTTVKSASTTQLSTIEGFSPMTIVWIVVGCVLAVALIVTIIIVVKVKKEKVY